MLPIASRQWKKSSPEVFNFQGWLKCGTREKNVCKNEKLRSMLDKPPPTLSSSFCRWFFHPDFFSLVMKSKHTWFEWIFCFLTNGKKKTGELCFFILLLLQQLLLKTLGESRALCVPFRERGACALGCFTWLILPKKIFAWGTCEVQFLSDECLVTLTALELKQ